MTISHRKNGGGARDRGKGLHADDAYAADGYYYPVAAGKFLLMSVVTVGLYAVFWMWKCWRWSRRQDKRPIRPFWRAVFGPIWLYPLFAEAGCRVRLPLWLRLAGAAAAGLYVIWTIGDVALSLLRPHSMLPLLIGVADCVCLLPALLAVNRLNAGRPQVLQANSAMATLSSVALVLGLIGWIVLLVLLSRAGAEI